MTSLSQPIAFRKAKKSDLSQLFKALEALVADQRIEDRFSLSFEHLQDFMFSESSPYAEAFCAWLGTELAGFILFSKTDRNFDLFRAPGIYIHDIFVYPQFRRQGIGRRLVDEVVKEAEERRYCRIDWVQFKHNEIGDSFFKSIPGTQDVDYINYKRIVL